MFVPLWLRNYLGRILERYTLKYSESNFCHRGRVSTLFYLGLNCYIGLAHGLNSSFQHCLCTIQMKTAYSWLFIIMRLCSKTAKLTGGSRRFQQMHEKIFFYFSCLVWGSNPEPFSPESSALPSEPWDVNKSNQTRWLGPRNRIVVNLNSDSNSFVTQIWFDSKSDSELNNVKIQLFLTYF